VNAEGFGCDGKLGGRGGDEDSADNDAFGLSGGGVRRVQK
jgi:hypothetical protein